MKNICIEHLSALTPSWILDKALPFIANNRPLSDIILVETFGDNSENWTIFDAQAEYAIGTIFTSSYALLAQRDDGATLDAD